MDLIVVYKNIELPSLFLEKNVELKFKNSSMMCFQIVQIDKESKKYVMDTSTISPKKLLLGNKNRYNYSEHGRD